ncbi:hypothetical protein OY671_001813 [Metschnikowia pulcherrima]|nr:hypothetical protein OY671_001813 [Metschnikowia pulcherrima]
MAQKRQRENASKAKSGKLGKKPVKKTETDVFEATPDVEDSNSQDEISSESDSELDENDDVAGGQEDPSGSSSSEQEEQEDEDESAEESAEDSDDESFPLKKKKKNTDDGRGTFANAFNAIIGSKLKAHDRNDPILVRNKSTLKKLESDKLDAKAKRVMLSEKREMQDKLRVTNLLPAAHDTENAREMIEKEKRLKKVAQKGVVKLFNAVLATQVRTNQDLDQENVGSSQKQELLNELTKSKFLDLVKAAGEE